MTRHCVFFAMTLLSACAQPMGSEISQGQISNQSYGLMLSLQRIDNVSRLRLPMDHGSAAQPDHIESRIFSLDFRRATPMLRELPAPPVWHRQWFASDEHQALRYPAYIVSGHRLVQNICDGRSVADLSHAVTTCLPIDASPQMVQIGHRSEAVSITGSRLTFHAGLGDRATVCAVPLTGMGQSTQGAMEPDSERGNILNGFAGATNRHYRFGIAYQPPSRAYLVDYAMPNLPLYRVTCEGTHMVGDIASRITALRAMEPGIKPETITVVDITSGRTNNHPAILISFQSGAHGQRMAVLEGDDRPEIIPYFCNDCLPPKLSFFRSDRNLLLFDAAFIERENRRDVVLAVFDREAGREAQRNFSFPVRGHWRTTEADP